MLINELIFTFSISFTSNTKTPSSTSCIMSGIKQPAATLKNASSSRQDLLLIP